MNWTKLMDGSNLLDGITVVVSPDDRVWFGSTGAAYRSYDDGDNWVDITPIQGYCVQWLLN